MSLMSLYLHKHTDSNQNDFSTFMIHETGKVGDTFGAQHITTHNPHSQTEPRPLSVV